MRTSQRRTFLLCTLLVFGAFYLFASKNWLPVLCSSVNQDVFWRIKGPLNREDPKLAEHLRQHYLLPPSTLPYNFVPRTTKYTIHFQYLENHFYTAFIKNTFNDTPPGFFIEAGALDGELASNTLWLEKSRNWTGLLIEASPPNCEALEKKHRKAWVSCSCITPKEYPETIVLEMPMGNAWDVWIFRSNARSVESSFHTLPDKISKASTYTYTNVQCFPLHTYLKALNISMVDLLSLDIQGGEKSILLAFPFDKIKIKHILVEYYKMGATPYELDDDFVEEMNKRSYVLVEPFRNSGEYIFSLRK